MNIKHLLLLLFICGSSFHIKAQDETPKSTFPITGLYSIGDDSEPPIRDFNAVNVQESNFHLLWNGEIVRSFEIVSHHNEEFLVRRYFLDNNPREGERESFTVRIDSTSDHECFLTIIVAGRHEKIHLIKKV